VFHVGDEWKEFFYDSLKPWIHYVPVDRKATQKELKKLIEFFVKHENLAEKIAENGNEMIWKNLRIEDVECFWRRLLRSYAKLIKYEIIKNEDYIEIK
jgi:protein glucosyltransferase